MKNISFLFLSISIIAFLLIINTALSYGQDETIPDETTFIPVDKEATLDMDKLMKSIVYPEAAIKAGVEGKVLVKVFIDKAGKAKRYKIEKSVSAELDSAAAEAIMIAEFKPAIFEDKPIGCWITIPVKFALSQKTNNVNKFNMMDDVSQNESVIPDTNKYTAVERDPGVDMQDLKNNIKFPDMAKKTGIEGKVLVRVYIDRNGIPKKTIIQSSDSQLLNQAAIDAVMKTKCTPARQNGKPIGCWVTIPIMFKLKHKKEIPLK